MAGYDDNIDRVTAIVAKRFRCFGGGNVSPDNVISHALKDGPAVFAAGVDIKEVVSTVIELFIAASRLNL